MVRIKKKYKNRSHFFGMFSFCKVNRKILENICKIWNLPNWNFSKNNYLAGSVDPTFGQQ